jgi:hypothetical protein
MTKKELFAQAMDICTNNDASTELTAALTKLLEPKTGGLKVDISEVTRVDEDGAVTEIQCSLSGVWLPADTIHFFGDKNSKVINAEGEGLYRVSKQADKLKKEASKVYAASKEAITNDVMDGNLTPEDGKAQLAELSKDADYSSVAEVE